MHTTSDLGANVPAFLAKLWKMVEDPKTNHLISWSSDGKSFFIKNQSQFTSELLPYYYKHNNMASFIRQLNMYGFHKKVSVELGGLKCDKDEIEFAHQYFCKDHPYLVDNIKRKVTPNKNQDSTHSSIKPEVVDMMLAEVKEMKGRQDNMDTTLNEMKIENSTLWRELVMLRQKHLKQQQIINKLIQFLVTLVQPSRSGLSVKRRYPLMINDSSRPHKQSKLSKAQESPTGPVIHELDASELDIDSDYIVSDILKNQNPTVQSPQEHIETLTDDENMGIVYSFKDTIQNSKIETKKKRICKGKKKRKNKVPVRILIPSLENGKESREDLHMIEISTDEDEPVTLLKNQSIDFKPVPTATVRSSKLAAMAARFKSQDTVSDIDSIDLEDNMEALDSNSSIVKLENMLTPEMLHNSDIQNNVENKEDSNSNPNKMSKRLNQMDCGRSILMKNNNEQRNERMVQSQKEDNNYDKAGASSSQDLLVSRINSSGMMDVNYREELNNHVETTQNNLDNFREVLRNENCNVDANALLELFSTDDPMTFGLPINPELNPNFGRDDDDISDPINSSVGSELMAYNPPLDLDDDMFMGNASNLESDLQMSSLYTHPLDFEDTKNTLDVFTTNNANSKS